jgi:hypothetical protein
MLCSSTCLLLRNCVLCGIAETSNTDGGFGDFVTFEKQSVQASSGSLHTNLYVEAELCYFVSNEVFYL